MGNLSHEYRLELRISNTHCPIRGDLEEIIRKIMIIIIITIIYWVPMVETVLKTLHMLFAVKKRSKSGSYETYHPSSMKSSTELSVYLDVSRLNLAFTNMYELHVWLFKIIIWMYIALSHIYNTVVKNKSSVRPPGLNPTSSYLL